MRALVAAALLLSACTYEVPVNKPPRMEPGAPGEGGRAVLWIESKPRPVHGDMTGPEAEAVAAIKELNSDTTEAIKVLTGFMADPRPLVRLAALGALSESAHDDASLAIVAATRDPHPAIKRMAVAALKEIPALAREAVFERAIRSEDVMVSRGAASQWNILLGSGAEPPRLVSALEEVEDPATAMHMVAGHCEYAPEALMKAAADLDRPELHAALESCRLKALSGPGDSAPHLIAAAGSHPTAEVRRIAMWLLFQLRHRIADSEVEAIVAAVANRTGEESARMDIALGVVRFEYGVAEGLQQVLDNLALPGDARSEGLAALRRLVRSRRLTDAAVAPALAEAAMDRDPLVRMLAAEVAGRTDDGRIPATLVQLTKDPSDNVRFAAAYSLGLSDAKLAASALIRLATDDAADHVNDAAYAALHKIVHGHEMPPVEMLADWLNKGPADDTRPFWGRDFLRWRQWYQLER